jgi:hypothetical protein
MPRTGDEHRCQGMPGLSGQMLQVTRKAAQRKSLTATRGNLRLRGSDGKL